MTRVILVTWGAGDFSALVMPRTVATCTHSANLQIDCYTCFVLSDYSMAAVTDFVALGLGMTACTFPERPHLFCGLLSASLFVVWSPGLFKQFGI